MVRRANKGEDRVVLAAALKKKNEKITIVQAMRATGRYQEKEISDPAHVMRVRRKISKKASQLPVESNYGVCVTVKDNVNSTVTVKMSSNPHQITNIQQLINKNRATMSDTTSREPSPLPQSKIEGVRTIRRTSVQYQQERTNKN